MTEDAAVSPSFRYLAGNDAMPRRARCGAATKSTRRTDLLIKMPYYARVGVTYAWVVDLEARVVTAHRLESGAWRIIGTYSDETEARIEPFAVVPLNVADWWPPAAPESQQ